MTIFAPRRVACFTASTLLLLLLACPKPQRTVPKLTGVTAQQQLDLLQRKAAQREQAIGSVQLDYLALDGFFKGEADVAVARPTRMRVELRSFFGQPTGALAVDGDRFIFVDNVNTRAVLGPTSSPRLLTILPLALPADVTVALLLGTLPPLDQGEVVYCVPSGKAEVALQHSSPRGIWRVQLGEGGEPILAISFGDAQDRPLFQVRFMDHKKQQLGVFPRAGEVKINGQQGAIQWRWKELELNGEVLPDEVWTLAVPSEYSIENY